MLRRVGRFSKSVITKFRSEGAVALPWACIRVHEHLERNDGAIGDFLRRNTANVYSRPWDVLVVLDGCRFDSLRDISEESEFDIFESRDAIRSVGAASSQWMKRTFTDKYRVATQKTAYVNGNPHSDFYLDAEDFLRLDNVWKTDWDDEIGTVRPGPITDQAIYVSRSISPDRLLVHYMQPHFPSIPHPDLGSTMDLEPGSPWQGNIWDRLQEGAVDQEDVAKAYRDNLRHVLRDVKRLLKNIDAERVVITSDHGNAFGEYGFYGHRATTIDPVRVVPWFKTSAEDLETTLPDRGSTDPEYSDQGRAVTERLNALGYQT